VVSSISNNFCLVPHRDSHSSLSPLCASRSFPSLSLFFISRAAVAAGDSSRRRWPAAPVGLPLSLSLPLSLPPPFFPLPRHSGGNNARAVSQYRAIIYFRIRKAGCTRRGKAKRETITQCCRSRPRRLDFAGAVIEDNWEQSPRESRGRRGQRGGNQNRLRVCVCVCVCARAHEWETRSHDSRTPCTR
jgi:hypothetical protein